MANTSVCGTEYKGSIPLSHPINSPVTQLELEYGSSKAKVVGSSPSWATI